MFDFFFVGFLSFGTAFLLTFIVTPFLIERMVKRKIVGVDLNKYSKPQIPEMGGISVFFGFAYGILVALLVLGYGFSKVNGLNIVLLLASFLTVLIVGFIGVFDDLIGWKNGIRKWQHALLPVFASLPLMVTPEIIKVSIVSVPFFGELYIGVLYSIILVPLAITGASNAVNMLAGMNGLEAGLGSIVSGSLLAAIFLLPDGASGKIEAMILLASILGALLAFLKYNWFPAKIFGGDSLTLMIGAAVASASVIAGLEKVGLMLFLIYFVELVFKSKHKMQSECFGIPQKDGTLEARPEGGSLTQWIMKGRTFTEKQVVSIILGSQVVLSALVLALFYMKIL